MNESISLSERINGIPVKKEKDTLKLNIIEVGTNKSQKKGQTTTKKLYCDQIISHQIGKKSQDIKIYKTVALLNQEEFQIKGVDLCIYFRKFPDNIFYYILESSQQKLDSILKGKKDGKKIQDIITKENPDLLYEALTDKSINSTIRGKLTETIYLNLFEHYQAENTKLYRNGNIFLLNDGLKKYNTEIDGVQTFYQDENFKKMIKNLSRVDHLKILSNPKYLL